MISAMTTEKLTKIFTILFVLVFFAYLFENPPRIPGT